MNSAVIIKIEHRKPGESNFTEIQMTGHSGSLTKESVRTRSGIEFRTTIKFRKPVTGETQTQQFDSWLSGKNEFRLTDANGKIHLVGDATYPARVIYGQQLEGNPGGWNGYEVTIQHRSPFSYKIIENS